MAIKPLQLLKEPKNKATLQLQRHVKWMKMTQNIIEQHHSSQKKARSLSEASSEL